MSILETCARKVFERLWNNYTSLVVDARSIETALRAKGDTWNEDHVAFRTFPGEYTGRHVLVEIFKALGYKERDNYHFEDKQLDAIWLEPPGTSGKKCDQVAPKVFVSELILKKFSPDFQRIITTATAQVKATPVGKIKELSQKASAGDQKAADELVEECVSYLSGGAPWARPSFEDYEILRKDSEYAAWTLLFGFNINHFTVSVQLMKTFSDIHGLNKFIQTDLKIPMNTTGGLTKGTPELRLEQSSSLAVQLPVRFQNGARIVPYAFVEFAYRWPLEGKKSDGMWHSYYQGFVVNNADKIFESTNVR
jgi:hypothetical protein